MLDYFKNIKMRWDDMSSRENPKKDDDKVFRVILAGFAVMIVYGIIAGIAADTLRQQIDNGIISMSVSDIIILLGIAVCYGVSHIKKK